MRRAGMGLLYEKNPKAQSPSLKAELKPLKSAKFNPKP